jgi:DNA-binding GntR family transcriptional regulator
VTSLQELDNLFTVRELLERFAMVTLAERRLLEVGELRALADDIATAVKSVDVLAYVEADRAFHQALIAKADNPLLTRLTMDLRDGMRLYGIDSAAGRKRQEASVKEHYELIDLAFAGNVKSIANLISHHILDWKPVFTAALSDRFGSEPK